MSASQSEIRSSNPRDIDDSPEGIATLKDISDKVDDARQVAHDTRDEFRVFQAALVGTPGIAKGALGEIRDALALNASELREANRQREEIATRQEQRSQEWLKSLPDLINKTVEDTDNVRLRGRLSFVRNHAVTILGMTLTGVVVAIVVAIFHIGLGH